MHPNISMCNKMMPIIVNLPYTLPHTFLREVKWEISCLFGSSSVCCVFRNTQHLLTKDLLIVKKLRMRISLVKLSEIVKVCGQNNDWVSKNKKSCHIWSSIKLKGVFFYKYEKIEICLFTNVPLPNEFLIIRYNSWY